MQHYRLKWKGFDGVWPGILLLLLVFFTTSAHSASKTVLVLGDSLSAEYGLSRHSGWVNLLERRLQAEKINATVINASISGETTSGGRTRLPALLQQHHPDIVLIELGANDALRGLALDATAANLEALITTSQKAGAATLLLGMQIPPNYGPDYANRFSALYPQLATKTHSALVPFFLKEIAGQPALFQADQLHPTAKAQPTLLDNVWPHLKPLLLK